MPFASPTFSAPADIPLAANAADSDGSIARVEFYTGSTLITTLTAPVTVTVNAAVASTLYYIHTDHLNTPRVITNQAAQVVWRWDNTDPFGGNVPEENPSGLGNFTCNLRLPGQYFDKETNTHYNYFRDYDPAIGRYVQSDPIGLRGGINTYVYAYDDPLRIVDPKGLAPVGSETLLRELGNWLREQGIIATSPARKVGMQCGQTLCARGTPGGLGDRYFDENVTQLCLLAVQPGQFDVAIGVLEECKNICKAYIKKNCSPNVLGCAQ